MKIDNKHHDEIKRIDVNAHKVICEFHYWEEYFIDDNEMMPRIYTIKDALKNEFGRQELVTFYKSNVEVETKFLAAMIWGHEAPANSRRDTRGPWKVSKMFKSISRLLKNK